MESHMPADSLNEVNEDELRMALAEWKRWRNRVLHAETMNRRQERYAQACVHIAAIEEEIEFRRVKTQHRRKALYDVCRIASGECVSLADFRAARQELDAIEHRIARLR